MDKAHKDIDDELKRMIKHLEKIYKRAETEIEDKANLYFKQFYDADEKKKSLYLAGKITKSEYLDWETNKILYGKRFAEMEKQITEDLLHVNEIATAYINDQLPEIYALGYNALKDTVDGVGGYSFTLADAETVKLLATKDKTLLPYKTVNGRKDVRWNTKKVNAEVLQGIIQGESIPKMAKRLRHVTGMNYNSSIRNARTATTGAENNGRQHSYERAEKDGIQLEKQWISADQPGRTRDWHMELDGKKVGINEAFHNAVGKIRYPGDIEADGANVYNCRCTMIAKVKSYDTKKIAKANAKAAAKAKKQKKTVRIPFVSQKIQNALGADFGDFANLVENAKTRDIFQRYSDEVLDIKKIKNGGCFYPGSNKVEFDFNFYQGANKFETLAHEMGHSFDKRTATALSPLFEEVDLINQKCSVSKYLVPFKRKVMSSSDRFLKAMREDKKNLAVFNISAEKRNAIRTDLLNSRNATAGVQDAFDGFFSTQSKGVLPWGHGDKYYNRFYNGNIKGFAEKDLKEIYKGLGLDASNQAKVKQIARDYETASELWANVTSAYTVGGKELEAMQKYMPNTCKEYEKILEELENVK